jgi:hypothetical protein
MGAVASACARTCGTKKQQTAHFHPDSERASYGLVHHEAPVTRVPEGYGYHSEPTTRVPQGYGSGKGLMHSNPRGLGCGCFLVGVILCIVGAVWNKTATALYKQWAEDNIWSREDASAQTCYVLETGVERGVEVEMWFEGSGRRKQYNCASFARYEAPAKREANTKCPGPFLGSSIGDRRLAPARRAQSSDTPDLSGDCYDIPWALVQLVGTAGSPSTNSTQCAYIDGRGGGADSDYALPPLNANTPCYLWKGAVALSENPAPGFPWPQPFFEQYNIGIMMKPGSFPLGVILVFLSVCCCCCGSRPGHNSQPRHH